jgi:phosphate-selective porin
MAHRPTASIFPRARRTALPLGALLAIFLAGSASADVVTGTVTPAGAKVVITNSAGEQVAELEPGAYQIQLPVGKYKAQCQAPKQKSQDVLVLSEPVTVNIDCT